MLTSILLALFAPSADRLGHPDYWVREAAEARLRVAGPLALPALLSSQEAENPEARHRVAAMLAPYYGLLADLRAAKYLVDPWGFSPLAFFQDEASRQRLPRVAQSLGCEPYYAEMLDPRNDVWNPWAFWAGDWAWVRPVGALEHCRRQLGTASWLFN